MKPIKKECEYCGDIFFPRRIDAKYCCSSCRGRGYRAAINRESLDNEFETIIFEIDSDEYDFLIKDCEKLGLTPEEFSQEIIKTYIKNKKK